MSLTTASHPCRPARVSRLGAIRNAIAVWRQRRDLARLDDRALDDIGLSRTEARREARRPIWDAPETWY